MADENTSVDSAVELNAVENTTPKRRTRRVAETRDNSAIEEKKEKKTRVKSPLREKNEVAESVAKSLAELNVKESVTLFSAQEQESSQLRAANVEMKMAPMTALLFQAPDMAQTLRARKVAKKSVKEVSEEEANLRNDSNSEETKNIETNAPNSADTPKKSRRGSRGGKRQEHHGQPNQEKESTENALAQENTAENDVAEKTSKRLRKRSHGSKANSVSAENNSHNENDAEIAGDTAQSVTIRRRRRRGESSLNGNEVAAPKGSTRLEAKRQRQKEGREAGRRRHTITESEFLARREAVNRMMLVRERDGLNQIAVIEDDVLVEHYVARHTQTSMVGNIYLGRVQNVLPSMEAAFVDIGKGRNAVLYSGEVNWEAAGMEGKPRKIEDALKSGDTVLVQVTKDPIGQKGARLTGQITLAGRHLVLVPNGVMTGISRKLPEKERIRLKRILKQIVPSEYGVIVRTAAEGANEAQLESDVTRLLKSWKDIEAKSKSSKNAPSLLKGEPELAVRVVRDVFNEDFNSLTVQGENSWETISQYVHELSPELEERIHKWEQKTDIFAQYRVDEQLQKAFDRKVFLPSGGSLVIDRTEAMTVIDVNTGKFTGSTGGTLEETVTKNNLEAAEEIVRQLRLRDIGGIVVIDFIDMILEANRDLVLRRLIECLGRDRTRHQVTEVTSLGLVQMTRKRVGQGLVEAFSTTCEACEGRGYISHDHPIEKDENLAENSQKGFMKSHHEADVIAEQKAEEKHAEVKAALANIAAAAAHKHEEEAAKEAKEAADGEKGVEKSSKKSVKAGKADKAKKDTATLEKLSDESEQDSAKDFMQNLAQESLKVDSKITDEKGIFVKNAEKEQKAQKEQPKRRRVSSTGTITPAGGSSAFTILSFPKSGKSDNAKSGKSGF